MFVENRAFMPAIGSLQLQSLYVQALRKIFNKLLLIRFIPIDNVV